MSSAPPGWYPDPTAPTPGTLPAQRWWDGVQWTPHLQQAPLPTDAVGRSGPTTPDGEPLAGWWWRVLASFTDAMLLGVVAALVTLPAQLEVQRELADRQREMQDQIDRGLTPAFGDFLRDMLDTYAAHAVGLFVLPFLIGIAYNAAFLRWRGATPGKMVCGLRVRLRERPGQLPWSTIAVRLAAYSVVPTLVLVLAFASGSLALVLVAELAVLGYYLTDALWAAGSAKRQALHDLAARTNVVRTR